jgi:carnitine 3-dehydrogenase
MAGFLERLGPAVTTWWDDLGSPVLDEKTKAVLIASMAEATQGKCYADMAQARDKKMIPVLVASKAVTQ